MPNTPRRVAPQPPFFASFAESGTYSYTEGPAGFSRCFSKQNSGFIIGRFTCVAGDGDAELGTLVKLFVSRVPRRDKRCGNGNGLGGGLGRGKTKRSRKGKWGISLCGFVLFCLEISWLLLRCGSDWVDECLGAMCWVVMIEG
jgi:hypothetical protein